MLTCSKIVFQYKNDLPYVLELHISKQKSEELLKKIEKGVQFTIEVKKHNENHKHIIKTVHNYEVNEGVLKIRFDGEVYNNGKLFLSERFKSFSYTCENCSYSHEPLANTNCSTSIWCPSGLFAAGCLAMAGGAVLSSADRPDIGGILMASAIACLLIVGIAKLCEKVSEKKQKDPDMSTCAAVKSVFSDIFCSGVSANNCKA